MKPLSTSSTGPGRSFFGLLGQYLAVLLLLLAAPLARAQAPAWQMAVAAMNTNASCAAIATDATGNVYMTGSFRGNVRFGNIQLTSIDLGTNDVYVAKWSPVMGSFVWAVRAGGSENDWSYGVAISGTSIYITGSYTSPAVTFGGITIPNRNPGAVSEDVFVAKLTDAGTSAAFVWAQGFGGTAGNELGTAIAVNGSSVYVCGYFYSNAITFGAVILNNAGSADGFLVKFIDAGATASIGWAQQLGGAGTDNVNTVAVRGADVFVAGNFDGRTATFGPFTLTNTQINDADVFVVKLTDTGPSGTFIWAQQAGGITNDRANQLTVSGANVYVTGELRWSV